MLDPVRHGMRLRYCAIHPERTHGEGIKRSGLRITEMLRVRVKDLALRIRQATVCAGKGDKDRVTALPVSPEPWLETALERESIARGRHPCPAGPAMGTVQVRTHRGLCPGSERWRQDVFCEETFAFLPCCGRARAVWRWGGLIQTLQVWRKFPRGDHPG